LEYIAQQQPRCAWELVVVDNGSTDQTNRFLRDYATTVTFPTTLLFEKIPGLSRARNVGWKAARGQIIAFTDDDCYVASDYVDCVYKVFRDERIGFAAGRVNLFDPADYPMTIRTSAESELFAPRSYIPAGRMHGANMMFRRRALEEIDGFDPELGAGTRFMSAEDLDAQVRASCAGWWGCYAPCVIVAHHHGRKAIDLAALLRGYAIGRGAHIAKLLLLRNIWPVVFPIVLRHWYWSARKLGHESSAWHNLKWEIQGAASYLALRLRKRIG
jgi:glycosyltransferase involved in cell wall biosynthesis